MRNKQINKFLFMFVVGLSLLFNFSSAELVQDTYYTYQSTNGSEWQRSYSDTAVAGYTYNDLARIPNYWYEDKTNDVYLADYNKLKEDIVNSGNNYVVFYNKSSNSCRICIFPQNDNFKCCIVNGNKLAGFYDKAVNGDSSTYYYMNFYVRSNGNYRYYCYVRFDGNYNFMSFNSWLADEVIESNVDILNLSVSGSTAKWDGTYYYRAQSEVPVPEFNTTLTDDEIASVVENFVNSMNWKNRESLYDYFFISYDENEGKYLLVLTSEYMYKLLSGLYIPAGVSSVDYEAMEYDTYSILYNNGVSGTFLPWQTNRFNYKLYTSLDGVNFDYYTDMDCKDFNKYRWTMEAPIIYSNFYLPFKTLLGNTVNDFDVTVNDYSEEIDLNFSELINSETGENHVFEGLDVKSNEETNPIIAKLSQFFKDMLEAFSGLFEVVIDQIFNFSDFLLKTYGENVVTLVFAILIKSVTVLVSSIALIFRAVSFILSLVAIPSSSALLFADVSTNTSGLVFSGMNWGTQFINGLNFVKSLSWNGLGLWTLFESFVSALEIILFVKIVRKHYNHTF